MSLRQAAQQAILLCEWIDKAPHERGSINGMAAQVKHTLEQALAEPSPLEDVLVYGSAWSKDGKRIDPMSVYKEPENNPFGDDAERYARKLHEERESYKAIFTSSTSQPEQEPVAHLWQHSETGRTRVVMPDQVITADATWFVVGPLYLGTAPSPRKPLSEQELDAMRQADGGALNFVTLRAFRVIARAIERAHGIGEQI